MIVISKVHGRVHVKEKVEQNIKINNHKIKPSGNLVYLGVTMDQNRNFKAHVRIHITKIQKSFQLFKSLYGRKWRTRCSERLILYKEIFESIMSYYSLAYYSRIKADDNKKITSAQRSVLIGEIAGYRTFSYPLKNIISGIMPK